METGGVEVVRGIIWRRVQNKWVGESGGGEKTGWGQACYKRVSTPWYDRVEAWNERGSEYDINGHGRGRGGERAGAGRTERGRAVGKGLSRMGGKGLVRTG